MSNDKRARYKEFFADLFEGWCEFLEAKAEESEGAEQAAPKNKSDRQALPSTPIVPRMTVEEQREAVTFAQAMVAAVAPCERDCAPGPDGHEAVAASQRFWWALTLIVRAGESIRAEAERLAGQEADAEGEDREEDEIAAELRDEENLFNPLRIISDRARGYIERCGGAPTHILVPRTWEPMLRHQTAQMVAGTQIGPDTVIGLEVAIGELGDVRIDTPSGEVEVVWVEHVPRGVPICYRPVTSELKCTTSVGLPMDASADPARCTTPQEMNVFLGR